MCQQMIMEWKDVATEKKTLGGVTQIIQEESDKMMVSVSNEFEFFYSTLFHSTTTTTTTDMRCTDRTTIDYHIEETKQPYFN